MPLNERCKKPPKHRIIEDLDWTVYILRCADKSLYTGITNDLKRRVQQHNLGTASKYTRVRLPVKLVYRELGMTQSQALRREYAIKALSKIKKEELVG